MLKFSRLGALLVVEARRGVGVVGTLLPGVGLYVVTRLRRLGRLMLLGLTLNVFLFSVVVKVGVLGLSLAGVGVGSRRAVLRWTGRFDVIAA